MHVTKVEEKIFKVFQHEIEHKPIDEVHITEIVEAANVSRSSFYHLFRDKYDLGVKFYQWFTLNKFDLTFDKGINFTENYRRAIKELFDHRSFYQNLFGNPFGQNSVYQYTISTSMNYFLDKLKVTIEKLSIKEKVELYTYICGSIDLTWRIFLGQVDLSIEEALPEMIKNVPDILK